MKKYLAVVLNLLLLPFLLVSPLWAAGKSAEPIQVAPQLADVPVTDATAKLLAYAPEDPVLLEDWRYCLVGIAGLSAEMADNCDANQSLTEWLHGTDPNTAALYVSFLGGIKEMKTEILAYAAKGAQGSSGLRDFLSGRLEYDPYLILGFGPAPERFLAWSFQLEKECPQCVNVAALAVLPWEMLTMRTKTIVAGVTGNRSRPKQVPDLEKAKAKWMGMTMRQRSRLLAAYVNPMADKYIKGNCANSKEEDLVVLPYLEFSGSAMSKVISYKERCDLLDSIKQDGQRTKVSADVQAKYAKLPPGRRLQQLSDYLKRAGKDRTLVSKRINELRVPIEMSPKDRETLSEMLKPALLEQIKTTEVGREVAGYYDRGELKLKFAIEKQDGSNAYFTPVTRTIAVSSALMSRYMRTNGYTMQDMLKSKRARDGFARFISPTFLHEAIHHVQNEWAVSHGYPDMYVKSKEEETFLTQSVYMESRMRSDPSFRRMVDFSKKYSEFIAVKDGLKDEFMSNPTGLKSTVDYGYYTGVPHTDGGRAEYAAMLADELGKRDRLPEAEQARLEANGEDYQSALEQYAETKEGPFCHIKTSVLEDMRDNLVTQMQVFKDKEDVVWAGIMARRDELLPAGGK